MMLDSILNDYYMIPEGALEVYCIIDTVIVTIAHSELISKNK